MSEDTVQRLMGLAEKFGQAQRAWVNSDWDKGVINEITAARSTLESALREALMPAGWKLVPVEPTPQMVTAGMDGLGQPEQPLGDAADAAGLYGRKLPAIPIAKDSA